MKYIIQGDPQFKKMSRENSLTVIYITREYIFTAQFLN